MAIFPVRGLADKGILGDINPYDLDLDAWSGGTNVFFVDGKAQRAPVWRTVADNLAKTPMFAFARRPGTGFDLVFVGNTDGSISQALNGLVTDVSPLGFTPSTSSRSYTGTFLGDVSYISRPDMVPVYFGPSSTRFTQLPNWDPTWRCRSLRAFGDYLVAVNVTKGTTNIPELVKWSDLTLAGLPPGTWDATDPTNNAGENPIADLDSPLVDSCASRGINILYSGTQVWAMEPIQSQLVFSFRRLFSEGGLIAPGCVVDVDGVQYVFGTDDIYRHDGVTKASIVDKRNRKTIFRNLNTQYSERFFAQYIPKYKSILFGYVSGDQNAAYTSPTGCNKGFLYSIPDDTGTFVDLPNAFGGTYASVNSVYTWLSAGTRTWRNTGGSWYDQQAGMDAHMVIVSQALPGSLTAHRVLGWDFANKGSLALPYLTETNSTAYLERTGIDLGEIGADITTYKTVRRLFPLVNVFADEPVLIQVGSSLTPTGPVSWGPQLSFNPSTQYKVDLRKGGRFLAFRVTVARPVDFEISGFDVDITSAGRR